jgi:hypothetical protein
MRKGIWIIALLLSLVLALSSCAGTVQTVDTTETESEGPSETAATEAADVDVTAMMPVFDALIRAMKETDSAYEPEDEGFFWTTLYLMGVNSGEELGRAEFTENTMIKVPRQAMQEFASACFEDYNDLLPLSDEDGSISYDEGQDAYLLAPSDPGDAVTEILDATETDGQVTAHVKFSGDDGTYTFTLISNPYASGISDPVFMYTVSSVQTD